MAKVFMLRSGEDFYLDNDRYILSRIVSPTEAVITREKDGVTFPPAGDEEVQLTSNASVFVALHGQWQQIKIGVNAPQAVRILRGEDYRKRKGSA